MTRDRVVRKPNLPERLLAAGFTIVGEKEIYESKRAMHGYSPTNGWLGCTTYHPCVRMVREFHHETLTVDFSLQGPISALYAKKEDYPLYERRAVKCIAFRRGEKVLYANLSGILPDDDFIEGFIRNVKRAEDIDRCAGFGKKHLCKSIIKDRQELYKSVTRRR